MQCIKMLTKMMKINKEDWDCTKTGQLFMPLKLGQKFKKT